MRVHSSIHWIMFLYVLPHISFTAKAAETSSFHIRNLEASLAASVASSTTVAVPCQADDCVVVMTSSPRSSKSLLVAQENQEQSRELFGFSVHRPFPSQRWNFVSNCFVAMTGFRADVGHLLGVWAKTLESHEMIYQRPMALYKCVHALSSPIQRETRRDGVRPFGVHGMLVGRDASRGWQLFTCDPSGLERHVPKGIAVIGKNFVEISREVVSNDNVSSTKQALKLCLQALVGEESSLQDDIDGLIIWWNEDAGCVEVVQIQSQEIQRYRQEEDMT